MAFGDHDLIPLENTSTTTYIYSEYLLTSLKRDTSQIRGIERFYHWYYLERCGQS